MTMSREARKQSETGLHHVLVQGPRQQAIFNCAEKKAKYLETVQKYYDKGKAILYAYCIMDNSAHLVLEEVRYRNGFYETRRRFLCTLV